MKTTANAVGFRYVKLGSDTAIEILYGEGQIFYSCYKGGDLADFDALLEYCVPNLNFEAVSRPTARWWEQELYRILSQHKQQNTRSKAFARFCERLRSRFCRKLKVKSEHNLNIKIKEAIHKKIGLGMQRLEASQILITVKPGCNQKHTML